MGIFQQSSEKKREKEIRKEAKELAKELVSAGLDKKLAKDYMEEVQENLLEACILKDDYVQSKKCMEEARTLIEEQLANILGNTPEQSKELVKRLIAVLSEVYHECTIRRDDMDFASTYSYLKSAASSYDGTNRIMLQSEFENLRAMLEETLAWEEPDFCALAYFCRHGNRADLGEIENSQRNEMILRYYKEQFLDKFFQELVPSQMAEKAELWIEEKIKQSEDI